MRLLLGTVLMILTGCVSVRCGFQPDALKVGARVEQGAIAVVTLTNTERLPMRIGRTHGVSAQGLRLLIEDDQQHLIGYPVTIKELAIGRPPTMFRLDPAAAYEWSIPLTSFPVEYGGRQSEERHSFDLPTGRYRLKAIYRDRCPNDACGETSSGWADFSIP